MKDQCFIFSWTYGVFYYGAHIFIILYLMIVSLLRWNDSRHCRLYENFLLTCELCISGGRTTCVHYRTLQKCFCSNLVDPASNHMLIWKIKPCMSKYNRWNIFWTIRPQKAHYISVIRFDGLGHWITVAILVLIHAFINLYIFRFVQFVIIRFLSVCQAKFTNLFSKRNL